MKKLFTVFLLLLFAGRIFSQTGTATAHTLTKTDYLKKSKTQKTIGWVLVGTGTTLLIIGGSMGLQGIGDISYNKATSGGGLTIAGAVLDLASIPFFIAGAKNKGRSMSVTINNNYVPRLQQGVVAGVHIPAIGLRLKL